jgi:hypothetical protein
VGAALLAALVGASPLDGQFIDGVRSGISQPINSTSRPADSARVSALEHGSRWLKGGIIGALAAVVGTNIRTSEGAMGDRIRDSVVPALIGFTIGALIGKQFPKD